MADLIVREAVLEDAQAIADILVTSWQAAYRDMLDPAYLQAMDAGHYTRVYAEAIFKMRDKIYVAERGGEAQGFILGNFRTEGSYDCEVKELYVRPGQQGGGVGKALLETMMGFFREAGLRRMLIWALRGARNNDFYRKMGGVDREQGETEVGGRRHPLIGFEFSLQ